MKIRTLTAAAIAAALLMMTGTARADLYKPDPAYPPQPAMFVLKDDDSTLYLFGSMHVIKRGVKWRTAMFDRALGEADEVWLESTQSEMANPLFNLEVNKSGYSFRESLNDILTEDEYELVEKAANGVGLDMNALNHLRPWAASWALGGYGEQKKLRSGQKKQQVMHAGVEMMVESIVTGKPLRSIENVREHMLLFSLLPPEDEKHLLLHTARIVNDDDSAEMRKLTKDWSSGDLANLNVSNLKMKNDTPGLYKFMQPVRNEIIANGIKREMKKSGTDMVIVGAAHLTGDESVVDILMKDGYKLERIYDKNPPVATNTERMPEYPNFRTFGDLTPFLEVALRADPANMDDGFLLYLSYPLVMNGCMDVSPVDTVIMDSDQSLDIYAGGYFVNIHPNPQKTGCGNASKAIVTKIPFKRSDLEALGVLALNLRSAGGQVDIYKIATEGNTITLKAPRNPAYFRPSPHYSLSVTLKDKKPEEQASAKPQE